MFLCALDSILKLFLKQLQLLCCLPITLHYHYVNKQHDTWHKQNDWYKLSLRMFNIIWTNPTKNQTQLKYFKPKFTKQN